MSTYRLRRTRRRSRRGKANTLKGCIIVKRQDRLSEGGGQRRSLQGFVTCRYVLYYRCAHLGVWYQSKGMSQAVKRYKPCYHAGDSLA